MDIAVKEILSSMGIAADDTVTVTPFKSEEDGEAYAVWKITAGSKHSVLKEAKEYEAEVYRRFLGGAGTAAPRLLGEGRYGDKDYILIEYVDGSPLTKCERHGLIRALDALISLQNKYWNNNELSDAAYSFDKSLDRRISRGKYLCDAALEDIYALYLEAYRTLPRTLCHDDLLPFNIIAGESRAAIIDWELGGILPYPSSLARLLAHASEDEGSFFYMKEEDKAFAVGYYYEKLVRHKGISYGDYIRSLKLFIFYEYCEWIMLGNKYADADMERYEGYLALARKLAVKIKDGEAI